LVLDVGLSMTETLVLRGRWLPALVVVACLFLALVLGLATNVLPWWLLLPAAVLPIVLLAALKSPPVLFFLALSVIVLAPLFKVQDVLFLALCAYGIWLAHKNQINPLMGFIPKVLVGVLGVAVVSAAFGYVFNGNSIENIYNDGRVYMYWLAMPLAYALLEPSRRREQATNIVIALGALIALVAVAQGLSGVSLIGAGRVSALDSGSADGLGGSVNRVQIAGFPLVIAALLIIWAQFSSSGRQPAWKYGVLLLLVAGIYFNFGRAVWVWTALCMVAISVLCGLRGVATLTLVGCIALGVGLCLAVFTDSTALDVAIQRVLSVGSEGGYGTSYGWRKLENVAAIDRLMKTYGLGVGVGGEYRDFYIPLRHYPDHVRYIHQGHLGLMLKLSFIGWLVVVATLFVQFLLGCVRAVSKRSDRGVTLGASFAIFAFLLLNNTQPLLMAYDGVMASSLMLALLNAREPVA
jgi:hypothetical protein